jgi:hypothetical protein
MPGHLGALARHVLLAERSSAEGDPASALGMITTAATLARASQAEGRLWQILALQELTTASDTALETAADQPSRR